MAQNFPKLTGLQPLVDINEEIQMHVCTVDHCVEDFDEFLSDEEENEKEHDLIVKPMSQQRSAASFSVRR